LPTACKVGPGCRPVPPLDVRPPGDDAGFMDGYHSRHATSPIRRRPAWVRRSGWLLFVVAVSLMAVGVATGHGLVLAAGLALAPFGLNLISTSPAPARKIPTIRPNHVIDAGRPTPLRSGMRRPHRPSASRLSHVPYRPHGRRPQPRPGGAPRPRVARRLPAGKRSAGRRPLTVGRAGPCQTPV